MDRKEIEDLNNPRFGSFGEFVFADYASNILNYDLQKLHRDGKDFVIANQKIDVGATRRFFQKNFNNNTQRTIKNKDVHVFFYKDCCFIKYPDFFEEKLEWDYVEKLFGKWKESRKVEVPKSTEKLYEEEYKNIVLQVNSFFSGNNFISRTIHRTKTKRFGLRESPGNLLPKKEIEKSVTVYIDFHDEKRIESNIRFIICIFIY